MLAVYRRPDKRSPVWYASAISSNHTTMLNYILLGETEGPTPTDMGIESESKAEGGRPTEEDIEDKLENLDFQKKRFPNQFEQTMDQLEELAAGNDEEGLGDKYYPGWVKEDFDNLISRARGEQK